MGLNLRETSSGYSSTRNPLTPIRVPDKIGVIILNPDQTVGLESLAASREFRNWLSETTAIQIRKQIYRQVSDAAAYVVDKALYNEPSKSSKIRSSLLTATAYNTAEAFAKENLSSQFLLRKDNVFPVVNQDTRVNATADSQLSNFRAAHVHPAFEEAVMEVKKAIVESSGQGLGKAEYRQALERVDIFGRQLTRLLISRMQPIVSTLEDNTNFGQTLLGHISRGDDVALSSQIDLVVRHVQDNAAQIFQRIHSMDLKNGILADGTTPEGTTGENISRKAFGLIEAYSWKDRKARNAEERVYIAQARQLVEEYEAAFRADARVDRQDLVEEYGEDAVLFSRYSSENGVENIVGNPAKVMVRDLAAVISSYAGEIVHNSLPVIERMKDNIRLFDPNTLAGRDRLLSSAFLASVLTPVAVLFADALVKRERGEVSGGITGTPSSYGNIPSSIDIAHFPADTVSVIPPQIAVTQVYNDTLQITQPLSEFSLQQARNLAKGFISVAIGCAIGGCAPSQPSPKGEIPKPPIGPTATPTPRPDATATPTVSSGIEFNLIPGGGNTVEEQKTFDAIRVSYSANKPAVSGSVKIDVRIADRSGKIATVEKTMYIRTDSGLINPFAVDKVFASDPQLAQKISDGLRVQGNVRFEIVNNLLVYTQYLPKIPGRIEGTTFIPPKGEVRILLAAVDINTGKIVPLKESSLILSKGKLASLSFESASGSITNQDIVVVRAPSGEYYLVPDGITPEQLHSEFPDIFPATAIAITPEIEKAQVVFQDDFESSLNLRMPTDKPDHWVFSPNQGGRVEIIPDPTGSGRGNVLKLIVDGQPKPDQGLLKRRVYLSWTSGPSFENGVTIAAPAMISTDVFIPEEYFDQPIGNDLNINALSITTRDRNNGSLTYIPQIIFSRDTGGRRGILRMNWWSTKNEYIPFDITARTGEWINIAGKIEPDGTVLPFVNGKLALRKERTLKIPPNFDIGFFSSHAGLYHSTGTPDKPTQDFKQGFYILNDNFKVVQLSK